MVEGGKREAQAPISEQRACWQRLPSRSRMARVHDVIVQEDSAARLLRVDHA